MKRVVRSFSLSPLARASSTLPLALASAAAYAGSCAPTANPSPATPGQPVTLEGHCVDDTGSPLGAGRVEVWSENGHEIGRRTLPDDMLAIVPAGTGVHRYDVDVVSNGYGGPILGSVTVTVQENSGGAPSNGLDQLGSPLARQQIDSMRRQIDRVHDRLHALHGEQDGEGRAKPQRLGFFQDGLVDFLRHDGDGEFKSRTRTLLLGADYRLNDAWAMGGALGISDGRVSFGGSASRQKSRGDSLSAYGNWNFMPASYISAVLSYEWSRFDLQRESSSGVVSSSAPHGGTFGFSVSAGHDVLFGPASLSAFLRWDRISASIGAFEESGSADAVAVDSQRMRSDRLALGAQLQYSVPVSWGVVLPQARIEYGHRTDGVRGAAGARLLSDNSSLAIPTDAGIDRNSGVWAIGLSTTTQSGLTFYGDIESSFGLQGYRTQRYTLGLRREL